MKIRAKSRGRAVSGNSEWPGTGGTFSFASMSGALNSQNDNPYQHTGFECDSL